MTGATAEHYTIISADCHAGGSHKQYREYLDPRYLDDFDAWRGKYKNPFRDLGDTRRYRNWDNEMRNGQQEADGIVGEVVFPNTVPPFFPSFVLFAQPPKPDEYDHRLAGIRAHNRWLVDWCGEFPERRAGIGQIFLNDIDDAIEDVRLIKENGLRGGILLPNISPDVTWVKPLYDPIYDRALGRDRGARACRSTCTAAPACPTTARTRCRCCSTSTRCRSTRSGPLVQFILSGIFERFPRLKFVVTESGCAWVPPLLKRLDRVLDRIREHRAPPARSATATSTCCRGRPPSTSTRTCGWASASPGPPTPPPATRSGSTSSCGAATTPTTRAPHPFTREHLRALFHDTDPRRAAAAAGRQRRRALRVRPGRAGAARRRSTARRSTRSPMPLTEMPPEPNEALLNSVGEWL